VAWLIFISSVFLVEADFCGSGGLVLGGDDVGLGCGDLVPVCLNQKFRGHN